MNASWRGNYIREFLDINIGVAVQTDVGLLVPVLPAADAKGLGEISKSVKELAGKVGPTRNQATALVGRAAIYGTCTPYHANGPWPWRDLQEREGARWQDWDPASALFGRVAVYGLLCMGNGYSITQSHEPWEASKPGR